MDRLQELLTKPNLTPAEQEELRQLQGGKAPSNLPTDPNQPFDVNLQNPPVDQALRDKLRANGMIPASKPMNQPSSQPGALESLSPHFENKQQDKQQAPAQNITVSLRQQVKQGHGDQVPTDQEADQLYRSLQDTIRSSSASSLPGRSEETNRLRQEAKDLYQQRATRNEWLDVAQRVAQAFAQLGAANAGMHSSNPYMNMSNINANNPLKDYSRETDRAYGEYRDTLKDAGEQDREAKELAMADESARRFGLGEELSLGKERLKDIISRRNEDRNESSWNRRFGLQEKSQDRREELQNQRLQAADLKDQLRQAQMEKQSASQLAAILANQDDFSKKSLSKIETEVPGIMGKAGIGSEDLRAIEQEATKKGFLWDSVDKDKRAQLIQQRIVDKKDEKINNLRQSIDALMNRRGQSSPVPPTPEATLPPSNATGQAGPNQDSKIANYAKQYNMDYEAAKQLLMKRGYTPAE